MDSEPTTAPALAKRLGISLPRLHRLLDARGVARGSGRGAPRRLDPALEAELIARVGSVPVRAPGLDRIDMLVLAALSRAGRGLESARSVARSAGVSPTAAGKSLDRLAEQGLAARRPSRVVQGRPRTVSLWRTNRIAWPQGLEEAVNRVEPPDRHAGVTAASVTPPPKRIPPRFSHLFWNARPADLDPVADSDFLASRLMTSDDPDAWDWALTNLPQKSLLRAAKLRGLTPRRKALIENLATAAGAR